MSNYLTIQDIQNLKRELTAEEQRRADSLIPVCANILRFEAQKRKKNLDEMIYSSELVAVTDVFKGTGSITSFTLTNSPVSITAVTVNGTETTRYSQSGNTITMDSAPENGAEIMVIYKCRAMMSVVKVVMAGMIMRELDTPNGQLPMTQGSESALGYSISYTLPNASETIRVWPSDLKALGLLKQKYGSLDLRGSEFNGS